MYPLRDYFLKIQAASGEGASFTISASIHRVEVVHSSQGMADRIRPDDRFDDVLWSSCGVSGHGLLGMDVHGDPARD